MQPTSLQKHINIKTQNRLDNGARPHWDVFLFQELELFPLVLKKKGTYCKLLEHWACMNTLRDTTVFKQSRIGKSPYRLPAARTPHFWLLSCVAKK